MLSGRLEKHRTDFFQVYLNCYARNYIALPLPVKDLLCQFDHEVYIAS